MDGYDNDFLFLDDDLFFKEDDECTTLDSRSPQGSSG